MSFHFYEVYIYYEEVLRKGSARHGVIVVLIYPEDDIDKSGDQDQLLLLGCVTLIHQEDELSHTKI